MTEFLPLTCHEYETDLCRIRVPLLWIEPHFQSTINDVTSLLSDLRADDAEELLKVHQLTLGRVGDIYHVYSTYPYFEPETRPLTDEDDTHKHLFVLTIDDRHPNPKKIADLYLNGFIKSIRTRASSPRRTLKEWRKIHNIHIACRSHLTAYQAALQIKNTYNSNGFDAAKAKYSTAFPELEELLFPDADLRKKLFPKS